MQLITTCSYIPEEIPQACGLEVNRVWPTKKDLADSEKYLPRDFCPYAKGVIGWLLKQNHKIHGMAITNCCDAMRRTVDCIEYYGLTENLFLLDLPEKICEIDVDYYANQLESFAFELSRSLGYSWNSEWLKEIIRTSSGADRQGGSTSSLMQTIDSNRVDSNFDLRIVLGSTCLLDTTLVDALNEMGARIVGLDTCLNEREVQVRNMPVKENLFEVLAEYYLHKPPCPRMQAENLRMSWLNEVITSRNADGVIWFVPKFCDHASYELVKLKQKLELPILLVEGEQDCGREGSIHTRLEAFCEQLRMKMKNKERFTS